MTEQTLSFSYSEYQGRVASVQEALNRQGYDALLAFLPESVTWLTGYFTKAYGTFQLALIPASGAPTIICRDVEEHAIQQTSAYSNARYWTDGDVPIDVAIDEIRRQFGPRSRLAIELSAWPLNAARYLALRDGLPDTVFEDAGQMVSSLRLIKSPAEIAYQRRAALAAEAGMQAGITAARAGATERDMAAAICSAMILAGSDLPGPGVLSSGERAFHLHGSYSDRRLSYGDIVQLETTPNVRNYHARFMRPMRVGAASDEDYRQFEIMAAVQDRALATVAPGVAATVPDKIYRDGILSAGLRKSFTNKTFYSIGLLLQPNGGEQLEAHPRAEWVFRPGMVFHTYLLARGFGLSETITITHDGYERLTNFPRQLFVV
ncbi:Xaa-Pro peptidase family protein [Acetobacter sp. TBRC 12305]|uniref:Aminopeptidase P family protein n=1 Tax=Acetobacter garciniae TaxID=2817435 RepID=A0A939HMN1_9PROT|nr:Xaa-Pro peptidase family protein [Acetobacter garciniae]MBO1324449.1 aminopeptidase P family protein [Acetobacter garciniae]MBX0344138.1 Xaa-Pro peptidase family protein [Acetobacter garciniae]